MTDHNVLLKDKSNFSIHSKAILAAFMDKGIYDYMTNPDMPFDAKNDVVAAQILVKLVDEAIINQHPLAADYSRKLWASITEDFTKKSAMRKILAMERLDELTYSGNMKEFIREAEEIHAELNALGVPVAEDQRLLKLVRRLPKDFASFKQAFIARSDWTEVVNCRQGKQSIKDFIKVYSTMSSEVIAAQRLSPRSSRWPPSWPAWLLKSPSDSFSQPSACLTDRYLCQFKIEFSSGGHIPYV